MNLISILSCVVNWKAEHNNLHGLNTFAHRRCTMPSRRSLGSGPALKTQVIAKATMMKESLIGGQRWYKRETGLYKKPTKERAFIHYLRAF